MDYQGGREERVGDEREFDNQPKVWRLESTWDGKELRYSPGDAIRRNDGEGLPEMEEGRVDRKRAETRQPIKSVASRKRVDEYDRTAPCRGRDNG